jgi:hypothetical protein
MVKHLFQGLNIAGYDGILNEQECFLDSGFCVEIECFLILAWRCRRLQKTVFVFCKISNIVFTNIDSKSGYSLLIS